MWRSILAVALLPSLTAAQAAQTQVSSSMSSTDKPRHSDQGFVPWRAYGSYTFFRGIRRGTTETVALQVYPGALVATPRSPLPGIVPLSLELQPEEGFQVSEIRYPKARRQKVSYQSKPVLVASDTQVFFRLRAAADASIGLHMLKGKLTFQAIDEAPAASRVRYVDVAIPINVVEHNAKVNKNPWPVTHLPVAVWVLLIVLSPLLIAVWLPLNLICSMAGSSGCLD